MYAPRELLRLAQVYSAATGMSLTVLATRTGVHDRAFKRLLDNDGINAATAERVSGWFNAHWPWGLPWPHEVPDRRPPPGRDRAVFEAPRPSDAA